MDAGLVEDITRWIGVAITIVGALIVSPDATADHAGRWARWTVRAWRRLEGAVRRIMRRPRTVHLTLGGSIVASGGGTATMSVTGTACGEAPDRSVEGRLDRLEKRADVTDARLADASAQANADRAALQQGLGQVREEYRTGTAKLHARLDHSEAQALEVDAAALPVVALGVIVSGLSPDAHRLPVVLWAVALAMAVVLTLGGVRGARRRRHAQGGSVVSSV